MLAFSRMVARPPRNPVRGDGINDGPSSGFGVGFSSGFDSVSGSESLLVLSCEAARSSVVKSSMAKSMG